MKTMNKEVDVMWKFMTAYNIATNDELSLASLLCGHEMETLNKVLYHKTGYEKVEHYIDSVLEKNATLRRIALKVKDEFSKVGEEFLPNPELDKGEKHPPIFSVFLGEVTKTIEFMYIDFGIKYEIFIKPNYYDEIILSFERTLTVDDEIAIGNESDFCMFDAIDDEIEENLDYYHIKKGLWAMNKGKLKDKIEKLDEEMVEKIQKAFKVISNK